MKKIKNFKFQRYFGNDGSQNYLLFQHISDTFKIPAVDTETVITWKSKGLSDKSIKSSITPGNSLVPKLDL